MGVVRHMEVFTELLLPQDLIYLDPMGSLLDHDDINGDSATPAFMAGHALLHQAMDALLCQVGDDLQCAAVC